MSPGGRPEVDPLGHLRNVVEDSATVVVHGLPIFRIVALVGIAAILGGFLSVLHRIVVITGDPTALYFVVAGAVVLGTVASKLLRPSTAAAITLAVAAGGLLVYVQSLPGDVDVFVVVGPMIDDITALVSGLSVLRILNADVWALSVASPPVFFAWYLALRRRYVAGSMVGGAALGLLVLTGDATTVVTLVGAFGVIVAVAFGDGDCREEPLENADRIVIVVAVIIGLSLVVGAIPGAVGGIVLGADFADSETTMETSLIRTDDSLAIVGSIELSPERRYTVVADEAAYWRVGTYDRYTGDGWVRTGSSRPVDGPLPAPPGETRRLEQRFTPESEISTVPAAREPTRIEGVPVPVRRVPGGGFEPTSSLHPGESYTVGSEVPDASNDVLRNAGTDYPADIEARYTQLPSDTPTRVTTRTDRLTAYADNPFDTARVLEYWFRTEYEYSLDVDRPRGDVADAFLFEMDAGYCTYFATTMVTMLRTQNIPARLAVGYTTGENVGTDEWVVRGYNSHAWVEVYVPEHGWIEFDPTPSDPREATEREALDAATEGIPNDPVAAADASLDDVDDPSQPESDPDASDIDTDDGSFEEPDDEATVGDSPSSDEGVSWPGGDLRSFYAAVPTPSSEQLGAGILALLVVTAVARRTGLVSTIYRELWLRRLPTGPPEAVVVGAYRRAVYLEERTGRSKAPAETPRQFFAGTDDRLLRICDRFERLRYGGRIDETSAAEVRADLTDVLETRTRLPRSLKKRDRDTR